jgi:hypothetical protein
MDHMGGTSALAGDWAAGNRVMCDFLHRGIVSMPPARHAVSMRIVIGEVDMPFLPAAYRRRDI